MGFQPQAWESPRLQNITGPTVRPGGLTLTRKAADFCDLKPGSRVLDIGCGTGATAAFLAKEKGWRVLGLDRSETMLRKYGAVHAGSCSHAGEWERSWNQRGNLMTGDAHRLPLSDGCVDAAFMECVLSLAARPDQVLMECRRVMAFGGWLVLSDIYARNPLPYERTRLPVQTCLNGAVGEDCVKERIAAAGFIIQIWADHSYLLKQLAGQLVFSYGSQAAFWSQFCHQSQSDAAIQTIKDLWPGYYLLIARKQ